MVSRTYNFVVAFFLVLFFFASPQICEGEERVISQIKRQLQTPTNDEVKDLFLNAHNYFRCLYGVSLSVWDDCLAKESKEWSEGLAKSGRLEHSAGKSCGNVTGENLAMSGGYFNITNMVQSWADERKDWNGNPNGPAVTGHWTAMIWKSVVKIGCGYAKREPKSYYYTCRYLGTKSKDSCETVPNMMMPGCYEANVPDKQISDTSKCGTTTAPGLGPGGTTATTTTAGSGTTATVTTPGNGKNATVTTAGNGTTVTTTTAGNGTATGGGSGVVPSAIILLLCAIFAR